MYIYFLILYKNIQPVGYSSLVFTHIYSVYIMKFCDHSSSVNVFEIT